MAVTWEVCLMVSTLDDPVFQLQAWVLPGCQGAAGRLRRARRWLATTGQKSTVAEREAVRGAPIQAPPETTVPR